MKLIASGRPIVAALLLAFVAACSVANYEKPVGDFAEATRNAEQALIALDKQVTDAYAAVLRGRVLDGKGLLQIPGKDCGIGSDRCNPIVVENVDGKTTKTSLTPEPALRKMVTLMHAIRTYSDGLAAIVAADTAAKVAAQVNATLGSVEHISATVANLSGNDRAAAKVSEYATPAGKLINWVFGQYVAKVQLDGLKRATNDARTAITAAASMFGEVADIASDVPRQVLANEVSIRAGALEGAVSPSNFDRLIESTVRYDQFLLAKPPSVFFRLGQAHDALADALNNDEVSLAEAMAKIEAFATEAQTLVEIFKELTAIGDQDRED